MKYQVIIWLIALANVVGCQTVETITLPATKDVYPDTMLVVSGKTSPIQVEGRRDYSSLASVEFRDAANL